MMEYEKLKESLGGDYFAAKAAARLSQRVAVTNDEDESIEYKYSSGDGVSWSWQGSTVRGIVTDRTKDSFTVDGNKITGDDGEPVYKIDEVKDGERTGQKVAKPQSSLSKADVSVKNEEKRVVMNAELPDKRIVVNEEYGTIDMTAVLATSEQRGDGSYFPVDELRRMAQQINKRGLAAPGFDHFDIDEAMMKAGYDVDEARKELEEKRGVLQDIRAFVENGKLWAKMQLDKAYKSATEMFKGLSIEAISEEKQDGRLVNSDIQGFIFTNQPKLDGAKIQDVDQ